MTPPIRILLIDDHTLFRESLIRFLESEPSVTIAGHCATVAEARLLLAHSAIDVILLDYDLGQEAGTDLLPFLHQSLTPARVLMLTAGMTPSATLGALNQGVAGIVHKQTGTRQLLEAIAAVHSGRAWWSTATLQAALSSSAPRASTHQGSSITHPAFASAESPRELTERQRMVLRGILDGLTNKEIAARLDASETSIKASIQELFHKAGVRTRGQLVRVTLERFSTTWLSNIR